MCIFDAHQDISDALLYTTHANFWKENGINEGWNNLNLPVNNQSDYPRLQKGGVRALFGAVCVFSVGEGGQILPCRDHFNEVRRHINVYHRIQKSRPEKVQIVRSKRDLEKIQDYRLSILIAVEGLDSVAENPTNLEHFYDLGIRAAGLTWSHKNKLAGGCNDDGPLTPRGRSVVQKMEKLGILVDLAHLGEQSFWDILRIVSKPPLVSHTNCKKVYNHPRNITDEQIRAVAKSGGAVGISGVPQFVGKLDIKTICDHIDHAVEIAGIDHVVIGSDFGAMTAKVLIPQFEDVSRFPNLLKELKNRGYQKIDLEKLTHQNILRILKTTLPTADS